MARAPVKPLVAIVGATGTGKSDLAVELALRYNGEIINGDAMQLYQGLPIITNKITPEQTKGVPHHLLGCIRLEEETWTVGTFVKNASRVIDEIRSRGKLPILVGGTHYYTQSLLFKDALSEEPLLKNEVGETQTFPILEEPTEVILKKLQEVDPVMASRWHPNERRKIRRSLEIYLRTGKPASQVYDEQRIKRELSPTDAEESTSGLRTPTLIFWVHASKDILYPRLDSRVGKMIQRGLLTEVQTLAEFADSYGARTETVIDQSCGIWVSIGYKEFLDYQAILSEPSAPEAEIAKVRAAAVEKTQAATRQYARRQIKWIQTKLLHALITSGHKGNIFLVDGSDLSKWKEAVVHPASDVTKDFLFGEPLPVPAVLSQAAREMLVPRRDYDLAQRPDLWEKKTCDSCGTVAVTENDWHLHIKSRGHKRTVAARKKQEHFRKGTPKPKKTIQEELVDVLEDYSHAFPDEAPK